MTEGTALIKASQLPVLEVGGKLDRARETMKEMGMEFQMSNIIRVKMPTGGSTQWQVPKGISSETVSAIEGVLVHVQRCGVLWSDDPDAPPRKESKPWLRSSDGQTCSVVGQIPDRVRDAIEPYRIEGEDNLFDWHEKSGFPYTQWGTGKGGKGKVAKEQLVLYVLRDSELFPLSIALSAGSLKSATGDLFKQVVNLDMKFHQCVVSVTADPAENADGIAYAKARVTITGVLDKEATDMIYERYTDHLKRMAVQAAEYTTSNERADD